MKTNVVTVNSIYDAFSKGDVPGILEHLSENVHSKVISFRHYSDTAKHIAVAKINH